MFNNNLRSLKGLLSDDEIAGIEQQSGLERALALMAASGPTTSPTSFASVLQQGLQQGRQAEQQGLQSALQNRELKQKAGKEQDRKQLMGSLYGQGTPDIDRLKQAFAASLSIGDTETAKFLGDQIKSAAPTFEKIGEGEQLINQATGAVVAQGVMKKPTGVQEYEYAVSQGYKGSFNDFQTQLKKAGATNIQMPSIKIGNTFGEDVAKSVAGNVMGQVNAAGAAAEAVSTIQGMRKALPNAITGTGANSRIALARLGQTLGVGGKDDAESLAATAQIIQGLAKTQLIEAQANKGQGTFTDFERALLAKASSGDINMTPKELETLFNAIEKGARKQYTSGQKQAEKMRQTPMFGQIAPFISVPDLPSSQQNTDPLGLRGGR